MPGKAVLINGVSVLLQYALILFMYYFLYQILRLMRDDFGFDIPILRGNRLPAKLTVLQAEGALPEGRVFSIQGQLLIGRSPDHDVVIDDAYISHDHAIIRQDGGEYWIEDLDSINHTYLNGNLLEEKTALTSGDTIKVGLVTFKFER